MDADIFNRCLISDEVASQYETLCRERGMANDPDRLTHISIMETLKEIGFTEKEIREYMGFVLDGGRWNDRLRMLGRRRNDLLDSVHREEEQISRIDYLKFKLESRRKASPSGREEVVG